MAFGGIAGLFLGCSLISAMEIFYFVLIEVPVFVFKHLKVKNNLQSKNRSVVKQSKKKNFLKSQNWAANNRILAVDSIQDSAFSQQKQQFNRRNEKLRELRLWSQENYGINKNNFVIK